MHIANATIAVTGATGFLGGYLVQALRARGARVIAVVRDREKAARLLPGDLELRTADLSDKPGLRRAFQGADAVISNAAVISFRSPKLTMRTNVDGTRNVFEALIGAGVERAVAISSSTAYPPSLFRIDERKPLRTLSKLSFLDAYGASKAEGERVAWRLSRQTGVGLTTFRPCGITGPFDPMLMRAIELIMKLPVTPFPALTTIGVVHAADVADAVLRALEQPDVAIDKAYNLQGCTATLWQIADAWRRAGGHAPHLRLPVLLPLALRYDDTRVRRELQWNPRTLDAILEEAVRLRRASASRPD